MESYEDYEREYQAHLARIRSFLAGTRNRSTLTECDRLVREAQSCAVQMQQCAIAAQDTIRQRQAQLHLERDIVPLQKEITRALTELGRQELFSIDAGHHPYHQQQHHHYYHDDDANRGPNASDMAALIQSSDELLRESQSILMETEQIGTETLLQMGRQREQLENTQRHLEAVRQVTVRAKAILTNLGRRACRSRLALYGMITVLLLANLYVLYRIYRKHTDRSEP